MHKKDCGKVKRFFRYAWKTVKWSFIAFLIFLGSLFFREQRLPKSWVDKAAARLSTTNVVVACESATYGFRRGLTLSGVNVYDTTRRNALEPALHARTVNIDWTARQVRVVGLRVSRMPDSYYSTECRERNEPLEGDFPVVREFRLVLDRPEVLGVRPERVALQVTLNRRYAALDDIHLDWFPSDGRRTSLDGRFRVDLDTQKVTGEVRGLATQAQVRPLLEALDIVSSLPYIDAFTDIPEPIPVRSTYEIDLARGDFGMGLKLQPTMGKYNGVPMVRADGSLAVYTAIRGTNCNVRLDVGLVSAVDPQGRKLSGGIGLTLKDNVVRLAYDVRSELAYEDALKVTGFLTPEDLAPVECYTAPVVSMKGTSGVSTEDLGHNDLAFDVSLRQGAFLGFKLNDASARFTLKGDEFTFLETSGTGRTGGRIAAKGSLRVPAFDGSRATFRTRVDYAGGSLEELADFLKFDLGERDGRVDAWCELEGPASTNFAARLNGRGHVEISEGHLAQMKMFAGLTSLLADKVPGVGFLVNQSQASADFTITNGIFRSDNVYIEGGVVSLKGWGTYDMAADNLDFTVRVQFMKKESLMGKIIHPVTFPFTKLLLEFKATGPIDAPKWDYISIIDRML